MDNSRVCPNKEIDLSLVLFTSGYEIGAYQRAYIQTTKIFAESAQDASLVGVRYRVAQEDDHISAYHLVPQGSLAALKGL